MRVLTSWAMIATLFLLAWPVFGQTGENWPGWRGPTADGLSRESGLPVTWTPTSYTWKMAIAGKGHSSPIVWEEALFLTTTVGEERQLWRIDRKTGAVVWKRTVLTAPLEKLHRLNSHASGTPATDGQRVYVAFLDRREMFVAAYDFLGNQVWEARPGPFSSVHGFCTCPVVYGETLLINGDHDGPSYLAILDKKTGATLKKIPRVKSTRSYSTPFVTTLDGKEQILLMGSFWTTGFDPQSGEIIWTVAGPSEQMVASLLRGHGLIFALGGFPERHLLAIREVGQGNVTDTHIAWRTSKAVPYVPSPLLYGDLLHVIDDDGIYTCFEAKTGKVHTRKRLLGHTSGSLVGAENRVYITDDDGKTVVLANEPTYRELGHSELGERLFSSPALSQGSFFLRGEEHLFRFDAKPQPLGQ